MPILTMKQLLEAGVHFGHQTKRWNPKMKRYIYAARNDIHIIDLQKTVVLAEDAYNFISKMSGEGKTFLFVGTKKQANEAIKEEAERCNMFYINSRWLGGTMTNFKTIRSRIEKLNEIDNMERTGEFDLLPKKEVIKLKAKREKLNINLGGIREMRKLPDILFVVDLKKEAIAIQEARTLNIPIVAVVDTNCDPDDIDYVIPGNDDAIRAVKLIAGMVADAIIEGRGGEQAAAPKEVKVKEAVTQETFEKAEVKTEVKAKVEKTEEVVEAVAEASKEVVAEVKAEKAPKAPAKAKAEKTEAKTEKVKAEKAPKAPAKAKAEKAEVKKEETEA